MLLVAAGSAASGPSKRPRTWFDAVPLCLLLDGTGKIPTTDGCYKSPAESKLHMYFLQQLTIEPLKGLNVTP